MADYFVDRKSSCRYSKDRDLKMAFNSRRFKESLSEDDEVGIFYTRNKYGQLRVPRGYDFTTKKNLKNDLNDSEPKAAICSLEVQDGKMSPTSLFSICLDFVAKNITMVESLCGFPDIVGKELFNRVHTNGGFPRDCHQTLQLFSDAYGNLVLNKLSLKNQYLAVNEMDYLQCFPCLTELDLSHCLLGSDHELLVHLAKVSSLVKLSLKDNCMKDSDLKHFTLPLRMMGVGPQNLSVLDLSSNPEISDLSIGHLTSFTQLTALNLSGTSVTMKGGVAKLTRETNLTLSFKSSDFDSDCLINTEGWASKVIDCWLSTSKKHLKTTDHNTTSKGKTNTFYSKKTKRNILRNKRIKECSKQTKLPTIILTATKQETLNANTNENLIEFINCQTRKRKCSNNPAGKILDLTKDNRKSISMDKDITFDGADDDIMLLYLTSHDEVENKKRKLCLADLVF